MRTVHANHMPSSKSPMCCGQFIVVEVGARLALSPMLRTANSLRDLFAVARQSSRQGARLVEFHLVKTPKLRITSCTRPTPSGKTVLFLKRGPSRRRSEPRIVGQGSTSRCIWITRSSRGLNFVRWYGATRPRRDTDAASDGVREPEVDVRYTTTTRSAAASMVSRVRP